MPLTPTTNLSSLDYYGGGFADTMNVLRSIMIGGESKVDDIAPANASQFQREADQIINSKLDAVYATPLRAVKRLSVRGEEEITFPDPVPYIARRLAAANLALSMFSQDIAPNQFASAERFRDAALAELNELCNDVLIGTRRLQGQRRKTRNHFVNPAIAPQPAPRGGPAAQGGVGGGG